MARSTFVMVMLVVWEKFKMKQAYGRAPTTKTRRTECVRTIKCQRHLCLTFSVGIFENKNDPLSPYVREYINDKPHGRETNYRR